MSKRMKLIAGAVVLAIGAAGLLAAAGDDSEPPITGEELQEASAAALAHTGGGTVTDTEVGDEESYYEVEVTLEDGTQVDVQLDNDFNVVGDSEDEDGEDDG
jgi:uncharacterized membrane protein YkoI